VAILTDDFMAHCLQTFTVTVDEPPLSGGVA
jgi:hypothetical protein